MKILKSVQEMRSFRLGLSGQVGFVPTMGALHDGHLELIRASKSKCDITIASIFLNPTQFDSKTDLESYPTSLEEDLSALNEHGVEACFLPTESEIYPKGYRYQVNELMGLSAKLCGSKRPGHFEGMLTVVLKLLLLVQPNQLFMGEKDYQQLSLVEGLIEDFLLPVELVPVPTIREKSGLALSSRNRKLSREGLKKAAHLFELIGQADTDEQVRAGLEQDDFEIDYVETIGGRRFAAVYLEGVRLIDNIKL